MRTPIFTPRWRNPVNDNPLPCPNVVIAPEPLYCGYDVSVAPTQEGIRHDRELPTYAEAHTYESWRTKRSGWRQVDLTSDDDRAA